MNQEPVTLLKVLVGSRAHHTADPKSDYDYRSVFVHKTRDLLSLGTKLHGTKWTEADKQVGETQDDTGWELGHFLNLAMHCNPSILEVFVAPVVFGASGFAGEVQSLFPNVWNPKGVRDAFIGYGLNQRKKFLEDKDAKPAKYASAYLRVLDQAEQLLGTSGFLPVDMRDSPVYDTLKRWRVGEFTKGEVIDTCLRWQDAVEMAYIGCTHKPNLDRVNKFLLDVRKEYW